MNQPGFNGMSCQGFLGVAKICFSWTLTPLNVGFYDLRKTQLILEAIYRGSKFTSFYRPGSLGSIL